jgi:hypothetical protein
MEDKSYGEKIEIPWGPIIIKTSKNKQSNHLPKKQTLEDLIKEQLVELPANSVWDFRANVYPKGMED